MLCIVRMVGEMQMEKREGCMLYSIGQSGKGKKGVSRRDRYVCS